MGEVPNYAVFGACVQGSPRGPGKSPHVTGVVDGAWDGNGPRVLHGSLPCSDRHFGVN